MPSAVTSPRDDSAFVPGVVRRRLPEWIPREAVFALLLTNAGLFTGVARLLPLEAGRASVPLVVRPFVTYWVYPLPVVSVLAAVGVRAGLLGPRADGTDR